MNIPKPIANLLERSGWTFLQAFAGFLLVGGVIDASTAQIAAIGALGAVLAVVKTYASDWLITHDAAPSLLKDLLARVGWTFTEAFLAVLALNPGDAGTWRLAYAAAVPAALALLKAGAAQHIGNPESAATLPARLDPTPAG